MLSPKHHLHTCTPTHMHTYTHAHLHTCTPTHMHTYIHAHLHTCTHMHTYTHAYLHTCTPTHIHTYIHAHLHTCTHMHTYTHAHLHTCIPTHMHTYTHAHTCTPTHIHWSTIHIHTHAYKPTHIHAHLAHILTLHTHTHTHKYPHSHSHIHTHTHSSTMDLTLAPTLLALTTQLVQLTGAGDFAGQEILTSSTLWEYSIPSVHRNEYDYEGLLVDPSPPTFAPLTYDPQQLGCYLRQIPGRPYNSPAFELEFNLTDPQSLLGVAFSVGSADGTGDYIPTTVLGGMRVFVPWHVAPATQFHVTVAAVNLNGLEGVAKCSLPTFDSSPPLARINPIRLLSGHPTKIETLLVLFDEYGLSDTQQVAIGTVPGAYGSDVMPWTSFNTSIIANHQLGLGTSALNLFSFSRVSSWK